MKEFEQKSDEELAAMVQQNKLDAFEVLVQRYEKKLSGYAKKFIFNHLIGEVEGGELKVYHFKRLRAKNEI